MMHSFTPSRQPRDNGFSFIELLAYMAIAALLILAAIPQFNQYRQKAAISNVENDLHNSAMTMEAAYDPATGYPAVLPAQAASKDVTVSIANASEVAKAFAVFKVNTGTPVAVAYNGGRSNVSAQPYYYGPEGVSAVKKFMTDNARGQSLSAADEAALLSFPQGVANTGGTVTVGQSGPKALADSIGDQASGTQTTDPIVYAYDITGTTWEAAIAKASAGADTFCLNGVSSQAAGQSYHYDSRAGMAPGVCS
ncbi:hypothetical protein GCM10025867_49680 (plasmid) [Frondihabitans sucicola]|uniref:Prepilin-type N-terminal cleavage/methylation domain-containing protein n=1 Tax=Frondihabitans sucicola TaxID=1268041 RepID=A0ABM8GW76_9MICO|nr:prepilin-type N-terminal cleavage/methylation domain-containing protein [Frondihabitans sucicola]BDZ52727.1 hypothetical protein GCM10025867_49680 [Frondihabitans sucicola]